MCSYNQSVCALTWRFLVTSSHLVYVSKAHRLQTQTPRSSSLVVFSGLGNHWSSLFMDALCLLSDYGSDLLASSSLILSAFGMPNYMKLSRMFIICLLSAPPWRLTGSPSLSCNQSAILIQSECDSSILTVDPGEVIYSFDAIHVQEVIDGRW